MEMNIWKIYSYKYSRVTYKMKWSATVDYFDCTAAILNYIVPIAIMGMHIKDGAYYCYCAYVLRISRYSDFLSPMLTNTGIFLRGLKLSGESRS